MVIEGKDLLCEATLTLLYLFNTITCCRLVIIHVKNDHPCWFLLRLPRSEPGSWLRPYRLLRLDQVGDLERASVLIRGCIAIFLARLSLAGLRAAAD